MTRRTPTTTLARRAAGQAGRATASRPALTALGVAAAALAVSALANHLLAKRAERRHPAAGRFVEVDGVRLHYVERGEGPPLVLLHGNGAMIEDFASSGLIDLAARRRRVIVFDRPGFGRSTRPRGRRWTPAAQAELIHAALGRLGVSRALVLGHSWGASVALALALRRPEAVSGLVLASGYYFPTPRIDFALMAAPAAPLIGPVLRHAIAPVVSRVAWPRLLAKIFGPAPVPAKFAGFPKEMAVRPSQIGAAAAESGLLIPAARAMARDYARLRTPVVIVAGDGDRLIDPAAQSGRLHRTIPHAVFRSVPGAGHMVHQTHPEAVMAAIEDASGAGGRRETLGRGRF